MAADPIGMLNVDDGRGTSGTSGGQVFRATGLVSLAAAAGVVAALYFGQALLVPVVLACLLGFLLQPLVSVLERWKLGRFPSVLISVAIATSVLAVVLGVVTYQVIQLADSLPQYQNNIEQKIRLVRDAPSGPLNRLRAMFTALEQSTLDPESQTQPGPSSPAKRDAEPAAADELTPRQVLGYVLGSTIGPLTSAGIVVVLVIFILLERKELRSRLIRLLGSRPGQLYVSTQALDDASTRVSKYLLMQLVVNITYGIPIAIGLLIIGVPGAFLWGLLTVVLRFIPYVGPIVAGAMPILLAFAVAPGWDMALWTIGLFIVVEIISNNLIEPLLYGSSTGISPLGIILAAVFWAWVWGPIGLLIATPMTVCLVVLGRYIPAMRIFPLLLGSEPVLQLPARIFQRLLAMDVNEPDELAQKYLTDHSLEQYYGEVLVPLLCLLEEERHFRAMDPSQREFVLDRTRDLIEDAAERADITTAADSGEAIDTPGPEEVSASAMLQEAESPKAPAQPPMVLNLPADDAADELAARMLTILLQRRGIAAATIRAGSPRGLHFADAENGGVAAVCISSISPAAAVRARRRVRRARASAPGAAIVLGLWQASDPAQARSQLRGQSNDAVIVTDLSGAVSQLASLCGMGESLDAGKQPRRPTTSPA